MLLPSIRPHGRAIALCPKNCADRLFYQISLASIGNSLQTYSTLHFTRRVYNGLFVRNTKLPGPRAGYNPEDSTSKLLAVPQKDSKGTDQVTPLAGRLFGTWTLMVCIVRLYAAYNLQIGPVYDMAMWTFVIALCHFSSELFVFKSMTFGLPQLGPFVVATIGLIWMPTARSFYVQSA